MTGSELLLLMTTETKSENYGVELGRHSYGKTVALTFEQKERLPKIAINALTEYNLGLLSPVSKQELKEITDAYFALPLRTDEEIEQQRQNWINEKLTKNEWSDTSERATASVSAYPELKECDLQKRKKLCGTISTTGRI